MDNISLKLKYQFDEAVSKMSDDDDEAPATKKSKKSKLSILEYSAVQLPVGAFIDYLENQSLTSFVDHVVKNSK